MKSRFKIAGLLLAAGLAASPAAAQSPSFSGRFVFQSHDLWANATVSTLSGFAESRPLSSGRYAITLAALQYQQNDEGEDVGLAYQDCIGTQNGAELRIECEVRGTSYDSYGADAFVLQHSGSDRFWTGVLSTSDDTAIVFISADYSANLSR
ncbi:hypothetical protein [Brevundimonas aurifodinae]